MNTTVDTNVSIIQYCTLFSQLYHSDLGCWMAFLFAVSYVSVLYPPVKHTTGVEQDAGCAVADPATLTIPFLSMVTRRSCLLCDCVQLMTGSPSPSSVVG